MNKQTYGPVAVIVAILLLLGVGAYFVATHVSSNGRGGTSNADEIVLASDLQTGTYVLVGTTLWKTGNTDTTGLGEQATITPCASATSTAFAVKSPFSATGTSTATIVSIDVTGQASSTYFMVGTSTVSTGLASTNVSTVVASTTIATSSVYHLTPGIPSFTNGSAGNTRMFAVAPNEFVVGYSTSTAYLPETYTQGLTCTVKIQWTR